MPQCLKEGLIRCLQDNQGIFAWSAEDMPRIDPSIVCHRLNIAPDAKPIRQKRRPSSDEKRQAITAETRKLLKAGFIRRVQYPEWLTNVVLVPKKGGKSRMYVDFRELNKACPKDSFPLPKIDQLVDSTASCQLLSFLDAYLGYNQIPMVKEDEEKTSFITELGLFCYRVMPFDLKNAGATY